MAARRRGDRRRDDLCAVALRKRVVSLVIALGQRLVASPYRLTRVVHDLRKGARHRLLHEDRQIVNNSAVTKTLSVDKSASLISLQPGNTHRPATNMHRKRSINHFNQSFGRVPVRSCSTNEFSFADACFQRLDYKAFAEREQCVFGPRNADQLKNQIT